jgi:hypothetical protein
MVGGAVRTNRVSAAILCACVLGLTQGCSEMSALWADRYGPNPVLDPTVVQIATERQVEVLKALAIGANFEFPPPSNQKDYWYNLTLVGFNVVQDQCTQYMEDLFGWERKRNRTKDILALTAATTAAVLGVTNASKQSIVLTAQAFGFASGAWTILADSYLYKLSPNTINSIEEKLQQAYRTTTAARRADIDNGATAYQYIRGYVALCLPVTIEYKVSEYLANTTGETKPPAGARAASPPRARSAFPPSASPAATPDVRLKSTQ